MAKALPLFLLRGRTPFFSFIFLFFRERVLYAGCIYVVCM